MAVSNVIGFCSPTRGKKKLEKINITLTNEYLIWSKSEFKTHVRCSQVPAINISQGISCSLIQFSRIKFLFVELNAFLIIYPESIYFLMSETCTY